MGSRKGIRPVHTGYIPGAAAPGRKTWVKTSKLDHNRHRAAIGLEGHLVLEKVHLGNLNLWKLILEGVNWVVGCWHGYVWVKVSICIWPRCCHCHSLSLALVNQDWFYLPGGTFLVSAHPGKSQTKSKRAVKWLCVCVVCISFWSLTLIPGTGKFA